MTAYNFGHGHPMAPERMELTARLARSLGLLDLDHVSGGGTRRWPPTRNSAPCTARTMSPPSAGSALIPDTPDLDRGLGHRGRPRLRRHARGQRPAGRRVPAGGRAPSWTASAVRAVNFGGGMHHAARERASGFCIYNDAALAIQRLLDGGVQRVAYIDVDAHHGDGTQSIFWDDPRVLTISLHETGPDAFPGHRLRQRDRRPERPGHRGERGAAGRDRGRRLAAGLPRGGSAAGGRLRTRGHRQPARLRFAPAGSADAPEPQRGRPARGGHRRREPCRPLLRQPLDRHRRRRLQRDHRGAARPGAT